MRINTLFSFSWCPQPERNDFLLSTSLPRLNTVANFTEKKIISFSPRLPQDEAELDNIKNEMMEENNKKIEPEYRSHVWSTFDQKKIISCNPKPTLDEIYLDHKRPQTQNREVRRESFEKKVVFHQDTATRRRQGVDNQEEYCLNLGKYHKFTAIKYIFNCRNPLQLDQGSSLGKKVSI